MKNRKKRGMLESLVGKIFILLIFVVGAVNLAIPDSGQAAGSGLSVGNVMRGSFMEQWEENMSDQFFGKSMLLRVKAAMDRFGGSRLENGIYIGQGGQLLEEIEVADDRRLSASLDAIKSYTETYPDVSATVMLIPDAACVMSDSLPAFAAVEDQRQLFGMVERELGDAVQWVDAVSAMNEHASEKLYYKTDDRWTTLGAFYVFQAAAPTLGIEENVSDDFVSYTVTDSFTGALATRSGVGLSEREQIDIYVPAEGDDDVVVSYVDESRKTTSLYDSSKLDTKDKYDVFLGGDTSLVDIRTVSTSEKRLLVVRDSFADCFIPFLAPYYREIVVVDPGLYSGTIADIMDTYRITDMLILYSGNSFFTDNHISGVFSGE